MDNKSIKCLGVLVAYLFMSILKIFRILQVCVDSSAFAMCLDLEFGKWLMMSDFVAPCKFVSCWLLLFYLEGRQLMYQKLSQTLKEVFNSLTAKHPEYQSCGSSLAAFIIERGKSLLVVSPGEWKT